MKPNYGVGEMQVKGRGDVVTFVIDMIKIELAKKSLSSIFSPPFLIIKKDGWGKRNPLI